MKFLFKNGVTVQLCWSVNLQLKILEIHGLRLHMKTHVQVYQN